MCVNRMLDRQQRFQQIYHEMFNCNRFLLTSLSRCTLLSQHRSYARNNKPPRGKQTWSKQVLRPKHLNPGLGNQMKLKHEMDLNEEDFGDLSQFEADFHQLKDFQREYQSEEAARREQTKYLIVRQKYFKSTEKQNFLTWAEKEQIRNLHKTDPVHWPVDKLVESFPTTREIVDKLLRSKWTMDKRKRIEAHDASVRETWKSFEAGELKELHPDFVEHLKKFANRTFDSTQTAYSATVNEQATFQFPKPKAREFTHVLTSMPKPKPEIVKKITDGENVEKPTTTTICQNNTETLPPPSKGDTYVYSYIENRKYETFDEFQRGKQPKQPTRSNRPVQITAQIDEPQPQVMVSKNQTRHNASSLSATNDDRPGLLSEMERHTSVQNPSGTGVVVDIDDTKRFGGKYIQKYKAHSARESDDSSMNPLYAEPIKQRIYIPRKAYKRGATFKLNDCFYDDDGKFLYRVPGLDGV